MVMKKEGRRDHNPVRASSARASKHAAHLAPPEELEQEASRQGGKNGGAIDVDTDRSSLPEEWIEERDDSRPFQPDPVVVIIFFLSLAFIAFITYLISIEPAR